MGFLCGGAVFQNVSNLNELLFELLLLQVHMPGISPTLLQDLFMNMIQRSSVEELHVFKE